jgi:hypothetical protein
MRTPATLDALAPAASTSAVPGPLALRAALAVGCAAAVGVGLWAGHPQAFQEADPDLARLLRGMAALKALIVLPAVGVVWWRAGHPLGWRLAVVYLGGAVVMTGASVFIWQLTSLALAAVAFHAAGLAMLVAAFGDGQERLAARFGTGRR